jgi:D-tyrosyl-tRNA(Tyr) deacylase
MRALVQRVTRASVAVGGAVIGAIGEGLCVFVGVTHDDDLHNAEKIADKIWNLRILGDADGAMNLSLAQRGGEVLVISQFTLYGSTTSGRRPSFGDAAEPELASRLVQSVVEALVSSGARVQTGEFGAHMAVELINDGPVTLLLEA